MTKSFKSNLTLNVKGHSAKQTLNRQYVLTSADPMEMMNHALHMSGIQSDVIAATRVAITDSATVLDRPAEKGSITVSSTTQDNEGNQWHKTSTTWDNLTSDEVDRTLGAIAARLKAVGIDI